MYLLQCPFYVKNYLRTHNRISLQGNPVTMQAEIDFLFSYFARFFFFWWGGGGGAGRAGFFSAQERCRFHFVYASIKMHHSSDKNIQKGIIMTQDRIYSEESSCP